MSHRVRWLRSLSSKRANLGWRRQIHVTYPERLRQPTSNRPDEHLLNTQASSQLRIVPVSPRPSPYPVQKEDRRRLYDSRNLYTSVDLRQNAFEVEGDALAHPFEKHNTVAVRDYSPEAESPAGRREREFWTAWVEAFNVLYPPSEEKAAIAKEEFATERDDIQRLGWTNQRRTASESGPSLSDGEVNKIARWLAAALSLSADKALSAVQTMFIPFRRSFVTLDCLLFIKRAHEQELATSPELDNEFRSLLRAIFEDWSIPLQYTRPAHLDLFLEHMTVPQADAFLNKVFPPEPSCVGSRDGGSLDDKHLEARAIYSLVDFYTRHEEADKALRILGGASDQVLTRRSTDLLRRCTNLLKLDSVEAAGNSENFKILPRILDMGILPDAHICTLAMQNAFAAGKSRVGWDLFRYMQSESIEPAAQTYLALLQDSYWQKDVNHLNEVLTLIHEREDLIRNPWLACCTMNIVRVICRYERRDSWSVSQSHMMAIYDRAFNRSILDKLNLPVFPAPTSTDRSDLPSPTGETLSHIIFLNVLNLTSKFPVDLLWNNLTTLIEEKDSEILAAASHPVFFAGFVLFYSRRASWLPHCLEIIQYMSEHNICAPGLRIWTFLAHAFLRHGQWQDALAVREMMMKHHVKPWARVWDRIVETWPSMRIDKEKAPAMLEESTAFLESAERDVRLSHDSDFDYGRSTENMSAEQESEKETARRDVWFREGLKGILDLRPKVAAT